MNTSSTFALAGLLALGAAATTTAPAHAALTCNYDWCGLNSPFLAEFPFHELSLKQEVNDQGMMLTGIVHGDEILTAALEDGHLKAYRSDGQLAYEGADLEGAALYLVKGSPLDLGNHYLIRIDAVNPPISHWIDDQGATIETYDLTASSVPFGNPQALCTLPPMFYPFDPEPLFYTAGTILYSGERYDAVTKTIRSDVPVEGWMNLACPGGALFKKYITRNALESASLAIQPTVEQRQAMFKMFTGDVCGRGVPYTHHGAAVHWGTEAGWGSVTWDEYATEAMWDEGGAQCLDTHRLGDELRSAIDADCRPSPCTDAPTAAGQWNKTGLVISRVPEKPPVVD